MNKTSSGPVSSAKKNDDQAAFDPLAPFVGSDGYEYADLSEKLLGRRAQTTRNGNIASYRANGSREDAVRAYLEAFDREAGPIFCGPGEEFSKKHSAGLSAALATGGFGPPHCWSDKPHDTTFD
jgi:hypothetical protein